MRYQGKIYRPPSEADSYILQATIGCSWNKCTYCDMYREKEFSVRPLDETLEDIAAAGAALGGQVQKVFVADGDALILDMSHWRAILAGCRDAFPSLRRVSCYAMASNVLAKSEGDLRELNKRGLELLYIGPESGDDPTLKRIAKGSTAAEHVEAAQHEVATLGAQQRARVHLHRAGDAVGVADGAEQVAEARVRLDDDRAGLGERGLDDLRVEFPEPRLRGLRHQLERRGLVLELDLVLDDLLEIRHVL